MNRFSVILILGVFLIIPIYGENNIKTLKSDSHDVLLIYPGKYAEGPDSLIYVEDFKDYYIKVYSSEGRFLRKIGGKGEGPGQIKRMGSFGFSPDKKHIFLVEYFNGHNWITFIDLNGNYKSIIKLNFTKRYGVSDGFMFPDGRFLLEIHETGAYAIKKNSNYYEYYLTRKLVLINKEGMIEKEFLNEDYMHSISMHPNCCDIEIPFQSIFAWEILAGQIVFTDGLSTDLKTIDLNNGRIGKIKTHLPQPQRVTKDDLEQWRNKLKNTVVYKDRKGAFAVSAKVLDLYKNSAFEKKPNVYGMSLTNRGNILLESSFDDLNRLVTYWLLDKQGALISKIKINAFGLTITQNYFLFRVYDDEENENICFKKIEKVEKEDFAKLPCLLFKQ